MTDVLINRGNLNTETIIHTGRTPHGDEGKVQGYASTSQENPRLPAHHHKLQERHGIDFHPQKNQPCQHLSLGLLAYRTERQ